MAGGALSTRAHRLKLSPDAEAARAEAIDLHGVCLYNNRQIGRRIKEGMHTNLLKGMQTNLLKGIHTNLLGLHTPDRACMRIY